MIHALDVCVEKKENPALSTEELQQGPGNDESTRSYLQDPQVSGLGAMLDRPSSRTASRLRRTHSRICAGSSNHSQQGLGQGSECASAQIAGNVALQARGVLDADDGEERLVESLSLLPSLWPLLLLFQLGAVLLFSARTFMSRMVRGSSLLTRHSSKKEYIL